MDSDVDRTESKSKPLLTSSFAGYLLMSFLTAANDNMFRWLVVPVAKYIKSSVPGLTPEQILANEATVLSIGLGGFILPFIVFAPWSGWLADRFSKRSSMVVLKVAELIIMVLGLWAISIRSIEAMYVVLFLMGTQSALLSTAKFGIIPEIVDRERLSAANGLVGFVTLAAVIAGTVAGNWLYSVTGPDGLKNVWISAAALLGVAFTGIVASLWVAPVAAANRTAMFPWNPFTASLRDARLVVSDRPILRVTLGIAFFWSLASLAQLNIDTFVIRNLGLNQASVGTFLAVLSVGVGIGSVVAGYWSGGRVELGIVPPGTLLMVVACVMAFLTNGSQVLFGCSLLMIGFGGGLFNVPLNSYLQDRSPRRSLGAILAAGNQLTAVGILLVSFVFPILRNEIGCSADQIFLVAGVGTIPILIYVVCLLPQATIRFVVWLLSSFVYRVRIHGLRNIPEKGAALLVANHVTWIDGVLLLLASSRPIRMIAYADYVKGGVIGWLAGLFEIIPIRSGDGPRALMQSLNTAREALLNGELVCIFAEGQISRTGELLKFERGMMKILKGTNAPVLPVYLDELWGSIFSYHGGRFFWKKPQHWPYPVTLNFGECIPYDQVTEVDVVRTAVLNLRDESIARRKDRSMIPAVRFIRQCRLAWNRRKMADSSGTELTGGRALISALVFHRLLVKRILDPDENVVGLLLPPSVGGALANLAVSLSARVTVNLNYTLSDEIVNYCIREAGVRRVITSRRFMEKRPMKLEAEIVYLEDLKAQVGTLDRLIGYFLARVVPVSVLSRTLGLSKLKPDDLLTVIFTSGSTGEPKGVMLSHSNINSNLDAANELLRLKKEDVLLGVLPFFHSFGYTITLWLPGCVDPSSVYHFNPLDARTVAELTEKYQVTIITATPTFLRSYMKRCAPDAMKSLNLVVVGAEKMPPELRDAWKEKYGFEPTEGYGATETSPLAAVNVPLNRTTSTDGDCCRAGTVGRAITGSTAAVFCPETGKRLGPNEEGLLRIRGANIMLGYLNQPDKTAEVIQDGWYNTGDFARIDEDGFIEITGRQSRFSKIGGEMVPHIRIEQELTRIIDDDDSDEPEILCAVTAVPDEKKGERLIVLHKPMTRSVAEIQTELQKSGLPNLWIPSADSFLQVDSIPLLGTGKLDLRAVKELAVSRFAT
ncbi:MAG: MFS transporter [Planctomycetaceae bacterium]|nr:MFS transporter [Planctomycetaceae bacterium]